LEFGYWSLEFVPLSVEGANEGRSPSWEKTYPLSLERRGDSGRGEKMIVITATMRAKEGQGDEMAKVILDFAPKFLKDPGCIDYSVHRRADNRDIFFFYEKYEDNEALTFHSSAPHFKDMFRAIKPYLEGQAEIAMYEKI